MDFNEQFDEDFAKAIEASENFETAETYRNKLTGKSAAVEELMKKNRNKYNDVKYYAFKAFENDQAILNEFGFDD